MKQRPLHILATLTGVLMLGTVLLAGCDSDSSPPPPEEENPGAEVAVAENESLGTYLTDEDGFSLYLFVDEEGNPAPCTSDECLEAWPPFSTEGEPVADEGVDASLLSTTEGPDGTTQVVYNGWPLWYFAGDQAPGDVNGQGIVSFGGTWLLVTPAGNGIEPLGAQVTVAENDSLGNYLADAEGRSLYLFTDEEGNPVPCTSDDCVAAWPIFTTEGEPVAGEGVDASLLGTTERSDGSTQVVYNDWPLYYFVNDNNPGEVNGHGIESFGGIWYLVTPAGERAQVEEGDSDDDSDDPRY